MIRVLIASAFLLLAGLLATGAGPVRAQSAGEEAPDSLALAIMETFAAQGDTLTLAQADSILALADSTQAGADDPDADSPDIPTESLGIHPSFRSETRTIDTRVDITNSLTMNVAYPSTWVVGGEIHFNRSLPRELTRESVDTGFSLNTGRRLRGQFPLNLNASRSFTEDEQNKGMNNYRNDINEVDRLNFSISGGKRLQPWLSVNASTGAGAGQLKNISNQGVDRATHDLNRTLATHLDLEPLTGLKLVLGYSGSGVDADARMSFQTMVDTVLTFTEISGNIQTRQDSLQLRLDYDRGTTFKFRFTGGQMDRKAETLDFKRNQYGLVDDSTKVEIDEILEMAVGAKVDLEFRPASFVELKSSYSTGTEEKRVKIADSRDREADKTAVQMQLKLMPWHGLVTDFSYKGNENHTVDYSADKVQSAKEFFVKGVQKLNESFKLSGEAYFRLAQFVYSDGSLDRDQAQNRFTGTVAGVPTPWLKASSTVGWFETRDLQIPAAKSISSKDKNTLSWEGDLDFTFFEDYVVTQRYSVSVTEEDFFFTKDKNALNTEYTLITHSKVPLGGRLNLDFEHEFRMRETGRYLPDPLTPGNPKTFFQDSRTKVEKLRLGMSYGYRSYLNVAVRPELGRDVKYNFGSKTSTLSPYGTLEFAIKFTQALGVSGMLDLNLLHRSKFGNFVRESQRSLWLPTLTVSYTF